VLPVAVPAALALAGPAALPLPLLVLQTGKASNFQATYKTTMESPSRPQQNTQGSAPQSRQTIDNTTSQESPEEGWPTSDRAEDESKGEFQGAEDE
jgi:hypothetical protein